MNWDALNRWLGCRLDLIGCMIVSAAAFAIAFSSAKGGLSGLMLSYALKATQSLSFAVRAATALENLLTSLDRVKDYCDAEQEEDFNTQLFNEDSNNSESGLEMTNLKGEDEAALTLVKVSATYAADLPPCLKSISFSIRPNELVGICGRTGSGKSTLALILSRLLPTTSGSILLGKQMKNVNTMSLLEYRDVIKIFPQESYIFSGTLRTCLDPSNLYTDLKLNTLLSEFIAAMSDDNQDINSQSFLNLDLKIAAGGKNLSEGQKQIVNLCRALLTKSYSNDSNDYTKIIVLDEITSNLDTDSARKVIAVIKKELSPLLSVLLISHRQSDLEQCDNLIVLSDGEIIAKGSPSMLMQDRFT
jgi:ABC-type multidrug transport system fused ATPase/permease subunit